MIITGRNPVLEALRSGKAEKVYVRHGASVHFDSLSVPFEVLGRSVFEEKFGTEAQGTAALVPDFEYASLNDKISDIKASGGALILDKIQDPHNFGAIIRAAHCFGINNVIAARYGQAKVTDSVYRASAGALFYVSVIEAVNLGAAVDELKKEGIRVAAAHMEGGIRLDKARERAGLPLAVIIGSEGRGVRKSLLDRADVILNVPMKAKIDSLNASMSAAVICYELFSEKEKFSNI